MHGDFNTNVRLYHKISTLFHKLKNYDSRLIMQELGKFNSKINGIPNGSEKNINNMLVFHFSSNF